MRSSSKPSPSAGARSHPGILAVVTGPSGVGKSTVLEALAERLPFHFSVSVTTRAPRPGERHGEDYLFVSRETFLRLRDEGRLLEWAEYAGELYGTPRDPVEERLAAGETVVLDIELEGARQVMRAVPEAISIFLAPPSLEELEHRLRGRGDTDPGQIERRLDIARTQMAAAEEFDHVVVNDRVARAVEEILGILRGRHGDPSDAPTDRSHPPGGRGREGDSR